MEYSGEVEFPHLIKSYWDMFHSLLLGLEM